MLENVTTEFKCEFIDDIKYTVIAFANTEGGTLYVGVNDDGSICGVENADETMLRLTDMIRDVVRPDITMFTKCETREMEGKLVVVLQVLRGTARPYYLHSKGVRPEGVYVRQGASSVPASETAILNMIKETSGDCYEDARSINQQLTFRTAEEYFSKKNVEFGESQKRTLNLIGADGTFSNLAMLLSDQCTHVMKLAVFEGSKKSVFRDRRKLTGSLLKQLEDAYSYIDQFNHTHAKFEGLDRIDERDYPAEALREALLNAMVHRDYSVSGSTLISIFDDRIEFVTVGGLVRGISYDDIMLGVSALRNQHLANVFYRLRLIEAYGTGIMKINESYADSSKKPLIEVSSNAFKITLPNLNCREEAAPAHAASGVPDVDEGRVKAILDYVEKHHTITRKEAEGILDVSQATAGKVLRFMAEAGLLKHRGKGRSSCYEKV